MPVQISTPLPLLIAGPTAVGKSEIALSLAETLNGEIVSVDSMQVYRGMDIGTAKPTVEERCRVPHHLIDVVDITETFDAARFVALAGNAVADIQARGHVPILCGGTGLYVRAFLEGLGQAPPADATLRKELENTPMPVLLDELRTRDPHTYNGIDQKNSRRVIRAIEVIRLTNRPFSEQRATWGKPKGCSAAFVLSRPTADLQSRIQLRVDRMFEQELVNETRALLERGLAENTTAREALGYKQVIEHLRGERSLEETVQLVKIRTRQYAKRQFTWFRHQLSAEWIELRTGDNSREIAHALSERYAAKAAEDCRTPKPGGST